MALNSYRKCDNHNENSCPKCYTAGTILVVCEYIDERLNIKLREEVLVLESCTLNWVKMKFLEFIKDNGIPLKKIELNGVVNNGKCHPFRDLNNSDTFENVGITKSCALIFGPPPGADPPKLCTLKIIGPYEQSEINYQCYMVTITPNMLLNYIIKKFSLEAIEREKIHLIANGDEVDFHNDGDTLLSQLNFCDQMTICVIVIPAPPAKPTNKNGNVQVEFMYHDKQYTFNMPNTETIDILREKILQTIEIDHIFDLKLKNEWSEELDASDFNRTLESFGVKPDGKLLANFHVRRENSTEKSNTTKDTDQLKVICEIPSYGISGFQVLATNTVNELIKLIQNQSSHLKYAISKILTKSNHIDFEDKSIGFRCLSEFFKPSDTIRVIMEDESSANASVLKQNTYPTPERKNPMDNIYRGNKRPIGLNNLKNSCYMNSALQCLIHIPTLTNFFLDAVDRVDIWDDENSDVPSNPFDEVGELTGAYVDLLWHLWRFDESDENYNSFKPTRMKGVIANKYPQFATDDQQDVQEFLSVFLEAMHDELQVLHSDKHKSIIKELFYSQLKSTILCTSCNSQAFTENPTSVLSLPLTQQDRTFLIHFISKEGKDFEKRIYAPISGQVGHVVEAFANEQKQPKLFYYILVMLPDGEVDFEKPLRDLPVNEFIFMEQEEKSTNKKPTKIPQTSKLVTLQDCLEDFFEPEQIDNEWICANEKCRKKGISIKKLTLSLLPTVLVIQFKRFSHTNGFHDKVETYVEYPIKSLNMSQFAPSSNDTIYDLIAVSEHKGMITGGHYVTLAKHPILDKNDWYWFDDSHVSCLYPSYGINREIVTRDAYLLFYIKRSALT